MIKHMSERKVLSTYIGALYKSTLGGGAKCQDGVGGGEDRRP